MPAWPRRTPAAPTLRDADRYSTLPAEPPGVVRPEPAPDDVPQLFYKRSLAFPRPIAWFGARSFWGHLWHLAASVIATEDIDSRDWMRAEGPETFTRRVGAALGATLEGASLTEAIGDDVWIDYVADTGDCGAVSTSVARMMFARYEVDDPDSPGQTLELPRGDLLVFGGDTAYPVATELEIHNRVIVPYNRVLRGAADGKTRVLLGVPGNHDWFAGLDGFHRMFHERRGAVARRSRLPDDQEDRAGQVGHLFEWIEAFSVGRFVAKRSALPLEGYLPVQSASYWALRLAPNLDLWGADRQLRAVDFHQQLYFAQAREDHGLLLCIADPVYAFLEPNKPGVEIMQSLDVTMEGDGVFVLTGDTHHYCRQEFGKGMHVVAGGGGAFLHPARILRPGIPAPAAEFPGPRTSLALALQVPWAIVHGRSGFLVHLVIAVVYLPWFGGLATRTWRGMWPAVLTGVAGALVCFFIGGFWRAPRAWLVGLLSVAAGFAMGATPIVLRHLWSLIISLAGWDFSPRWFLGLSFAITVYVATLLFGTYLMLLTLLGLEQHQAFGALAHPGYKHFVRLRVRKDGSRVDGWVLGRVDPLSKKDKVVLVDRFSWLNPARRRSGPATD